MFIRMKIISKFFFVLVSTESTLDYFIDKDIRIFLSSAAHIFLGFKSGDSSPSTRSKFADLKDFQTLSRISRDDDSFTIRLGTEYLCSDSGQIVKCGENNRWKIIEKPFGYSIVQNSKCLTLFAKSNLRLMTCTDSNDQIFDFRFANEDKICGSDVKPNKMNNHEANKNNLILFNIGSNKHKFRRKHFHKNDFIGGESSEIHHNLKKYHKRNDFVELVQNQI